MICGRFGGQFAGCGGFAFMILTFICVLMWRFTRHPQGDFASHVALLSKHSIAIQFVWGFECFGSFRHPQGIVGLSECWFLNKIWFDKIQVILPWYFPKSNSAFPDIFRSRFRSYLACALYIPFHKVSSLPAGTLRNSKMIWTLNCSFVPLHFWQFPKPEELYCLFPQTYQ